MKSTCSYLTARAIFIFVLAVEMLVFSWFNVIPRIANDFAFLQSGPPILFVNTSDAINHEIWHPSDQWIHDCIRHEADDDILSAPMDQDPWLNYRLGDCIRDCMACLEFINTTQIEELSSFAGQYWFKACRKPRRDSRTSNNFSLIYDIARQYEHAPYTDSSLWNVPKYDEVVVHITMDDAMDASLSKRNMTPLEMLRSGVTIEHWPGDPYPDKFWSITEYLELFQELGLRKVVIRSTPYKTQAFPKLKVYTRCLIGAFEEAGLVTTGESNDDKTHNPDHDFFFMSHASHFIPSSDGYSRIVSRLVDMHGGRIIHLPQGKPKPDTALQHKSMDKYLIYMTTIFSEHHQRMFQYCWPELLKKSKFLQKADIVIFSNNQTEINHTSISFVRELFSGNPSFRFEFASNVTLREMKNPTLRDKSIANRKSTRFQFGANEAVHLGFVNSWFSNYSWIIRINPDVLILNSTWILDTMNDPTVDGIFVECKKAPEYWQIHTDFFAVRPSACRRDAFGEMVHEFNGSAGVNHELTATKEFEHIIRANRHRWLPDNKPSRGYCRVRGPGSSVSHDHTILNVDENGTTTCNLEM